MLLRTNNIFELVTLSPVRKSKSEEEIESSSEVIKENADSEDDTTEVGEISVKTFESNFDF